MAPNVYHQGRGGGGFFVELFRKLNTSQYNPRSIICPENWEMSHFHIFLLSSTSCKNSTLCLFEDLTQFCDLDFLEDGTKDDVVGGQVEGK